MIMVTAGDGGASLTARKRARCSRSGARGEGGAGGKAAGALTAWSPLAVAGEFPAGAAGVSVSPCPVAGRCSREIRLRRRRWRRPSRQRLWVGEKAAAAV